MQPPFSLFFEIASKTYPKGKFFLFLTINFEQKIGRNLSIMDKFQAKSGLFVLIDVQN